MSNSRRIRRSRPDRDDPSAPYPWNMLVAGSTVTERRQLFELRNLCLAAGFDIDELVEREGDLGDGPRTRSHDIADFLDALGTWRRLERLVVGGYGLGRRAELN